jgi:hypothetical protein
MLHLHLHLHFHTAYISYVFKHQSFDSWSMGTHGCSDIFCKQLWFQWYVWCLLRFLAILDVQSTFDVDHTRILVNCLLKGVNFLRKHKKTSFSLKQQTRDDANIFLTPFWITQSQGMCLWHFSWWPCPESNTDQGLHELAQWLRGHNKVRSLVRLVVSLGRAYFILYTVCYHVFCDLHICCQLLSAWVKHPTISHRSATSSISVVLPAEALRQLILQLAASGEVKAQLGAKPRIGSRGATLRFSNLLY